MNFIKTYKYPLSITLSLVAIFIIFQNCGTKVSSTTPDPLLSTTATTNNNSNTAALTIYPATATVPRNGSISFSGSGGTQPYTYSVTYGGGTVTASGVYTAPSTVSSTGIMITDANQQHAYATVSVTSGTTSTPTPVPSSGTATMHALPGKFISATTNSQYPQATWNINHLTDNDSSSCYSSLPYSHGAITGSTIKPYVILNVGNVITGTAGAYSISRLFLRSRSMIVNYAPTLMHFPASYEIKILSADGMQWNSIGTFTTQPDFDGIARIQFSQSYTTTKMVIIANDLGPVESGIYYFQLCEVSN